MPLTPQEEAELRALEGEVGGGLSAQEEAELASLEKEMAPVQDNTRHGQAALEGFGQTASQGYLAHLQAAVENMLPSPTRDVDAKLREQGFTVPEDNYVKMRDENLARQEQLAKEAPLANLLGKAGGIGASMLVPGGQMAKGASLGKAMGTAALQGAAQGAVYNPGDTAGELNPIQIEQRMSNAALGAGLGAAGGAVAKGIGTLADKSRMVERVKDSAGLSKSVKQEVDAALKGVNERAIKPKANALKELLQGQKVTLDINDASGVSPEVDRYIMSHVKKSLPKGWQGVKNLDEIPSHMLKDIPREIEVPANIGNKIKQKFASVANHAKSKPFEPGSATRDAAASEAASTLRGKLSKLHPDVDRLNSEMGEAIRIRDVIGDRAKTAPIASIRGRPGTDKGSMIDFVDKVGGSKLEQLSSRIEDAKDLLIDPSNLVKPLQLPNEVRKIGVRGAAGAARGLQKITPADMDSALFRALLEAKKE